MFEHHSDVLASFKTIIAHENGVIMYKKHEHTQKDFEICS